MAIVRPEYMVTGKKRRRRLVPWLVVAAANLVWIIASGEVPWAGG